MAAPSKRHASSLDTTPMITVPKQQLIGMFSVYVTEAGCVHVLLLGTVPDMEILPWKGRYSHVSYSVVQNSAANVVSQYTRRRDNSYLPQAKLTVYQKGAYYSGIKIFINLPSEINPLTPNDPYSGRTAPLILKVAFYIFIQQIYRYWIF